MSVQFDMPTKEPNVIKVIGVGGGGNNAVNYMMDQGIVGVDFAICNTDKQVLEESHVPIKMQLGPQLTDGKGAGNKPEVGRQACMESIKEVQAFLANNTKMLFITAGMGGGTGTGAAPVIASVAREMGILTIGIITRPFSFEGKSRRVNGAKGIEEIREQVDTLVVISNDKILELYPSLSVKEAFSKADNILSSASKAIAEIITKPGYINVDLEDVNTVMRNGGVAVMGTAVVEGEDRAKKAVEQALTSPLLEDNDIKGAGSILLNITTGTDDIKAEELTQITSMIQEAAGDADMIWGNCYDKDLNKALSLTIIATGFEKKLEKKVEKPVEPKQEKIVPKREVIDLYGSDDSFFEVDASVKRHVIQFDLQNVESSVELVEEAPVKQKSVRQRAKFTATDVSKLDQETLEYYERIPAYQRKEVKLQDEISSHGEMSLLSISGEGGDGISIKNSYLHDNVD